MKLGRLFGNTELERPIKSLEELLNEPRLERNPGGGMERDVETMISVTSILASRSRFKKSPDSKD